MKRLLAALLALVLVLSLIPAVAIPEADAAEIVSDLEWKQGSYYASLNTGVTIRRYTVIPCQEGEVYTLKFPSDNWAIYAHFADAQGDFGKEYLLRTGKPLDIVVREMDDRIPTEIRLTTYYRPNTNLVLDDAGFASFDVTISKTTRVVGDILWDATWNQGTPVNPSTALRKHTWIPCQVGDTFRFGFVSTYWDMYVLPGDENGPLTDDDTYFSKDGTFTVAPVDGKNPTGIYVVAVPDPQGTSITDLIWDSRSVSCVKEVKESTIDTNTFTFATQNLGLWNDGVNQGVAANKVEERAAAWQAKMTEHGIDILVCQEWLPYLDADKTVDANTKVFGGMYPYMYGTNASTYDGKTIVSKAPLSNISYETMVSNVGRRYLKTYTTIGGKQVCIIDAHLSFEEDINTNRKEEIVQLLNIAQSEKYVIIAGDFNVFTADEFEIFEEAGYSLANAGAFGEFNTWPNLGRNPTADVNRVIDNIIVSPGIKINSVVAEDTKLSDHALLVAQLELLEDAEITDNRLLCEHCNKFVTWIPITETNGSQATAIRESGHYYLPNDLTKVNSQFWIGVVNEATPDVVIDLRGHEVKSSARVFYIRKGSKLTIVDTIGCGTMTAASTSTGGFAYVENSASFTLYDGSIYSTGNPTSDRKGGTFYLETSASFAIYGGEIHGGKSSHGSAICAGNLNNILIEGGIIYGGTATTAGGAIHMTGGTLTMNKGTITGGQSSNGGGLYLYSTTANLNGGTIYGCSGTYGGNVHTAGNESKGVLNLGNCNIYGGTASGSGADVYVSSSGKACLVTKEATFKDGSGKNVTTTAGDMVLYVNGYYTVHDHNMVTDVAVDPTCTITGLTEGKHCTGCDTQTVVQEEIPALGHSYESAYTAPTYTADAFTTYTCKACGDSYKETHAGTMLTGVAAVNGTPYDTLEEALENAEAGATVKLLQAASVDTLLLSGGITLDLNGQELTADQLVAIKNTHIIDSTNGQALVKIARDSVSVQNTNAQLLLWDAEAGGYRFVEVSLSQQAERKENGDGYFHFYIQGSDANCALQQALVDGGADNGVYVQVKLVWTDVSGNVAQRTFVYSEELVAMYAENWTTREFRLTVTGMENVQQLHLTAQIVYKGAADSAKNDVAVCGTTKTLTK